MREAKLSGSTPTVRMGLWVNLTKLGGRMKSVPYPDLDLTIDIPKPIAVQQIGVRVTRLVCETDVDSVNYSPSCASLVICSSSPSSRPPFFHAFILSHQDEYCVCSLVLHGFLIDARVGVRPHG